MSIRRRVPLIQRTPTLIRPDPNVRTPSLIPEMRNDPGAGVSSPVGELIRAPRGDFSAYSNIGNTEWTQIIGRDPRRNYLEIQNKSGSIIDVSFGNTASFFQIEPLGTWWAPVAPINEIWVRSPSGALCAVVVGSD